MNLKYSRVGFDTYCWTTTAGGSTTVERIGLFLRLRIINNTKRAAPKDVAISVLSVEECPPGTTAFVPIRRADYPKPLVWSYTRGLRERGVTQLPALTERERFVDLAVIHQPRGQQPTELVLTTEPEPRDDSHRFPPGDYRFRLVLADSRRRQIELTADVALTGAWSADRPNEVAHFVLHEGRRE